MTTISARDRQALFLVPFAIAAVLAGGCYSVIPSAADAGGAVADDGALAHDAAEPGADRGTAGDADAAEGHDAGAADPDGGSSEDAADAGAYPDAGVDLDAGGAPDGADPDAGQPDDAGEPNDGGCQGKPPIIFARPEAFIPKEAAPVLHVEIPMEKGLVFGRVELELEFVRGPWSTIPPGPSRGMHNVFWLHRGMKGNHWLGNVVGYMNFKSQVNLELSTNLGVTDPAVWDQSLPDHVRTAEGATYHVLFVYDAAGAKVSYRADEAGVEFAYAEAVPLVAEIVGWDIFQGGSPGFFIEIGHLPSTTGGVELPSYDWVYKNLVIRFHHLDGC